MSMWDHVRSNGWPIVLPDDDGLRPLGGSGECTYCRSKVGQPHGPECVTVTKLVRYDVLDPASRKCIGTLEDYEPCSSDTEACEFHKNESSWCATNAVPHIQWSDAKAQATVMATYADEHYDCCCDLLEFRFVCCLDQGPFIVRRPTAGAQT